MSVRDQIRTDLLDLEMLSHLEGCGSINWNNSVTWQCRGEGTGGGAGSEDWVDADHLSQYLEVSLIGHMMRSHDLFQAH